MTSLLLSTRYNVSSSSVVVGDKPCFAPKWNLCAQTTIIKHTATYIKETNRFPLISGSQTLPWHSQPSFPQRNIGASQTDVNLNDVGFLLPA
jgi:hypothetical protein